MLFRRPPTSSTIAGTVFILLTISSWSTSINGVVDASTASLGVRLSEFTYARSYGDFPGATLSTGVFRDLAMHCSKYMSVWNTDENFGLVAYGDNFQYDANGYPYDIDREGMAAVCTIGSLCIGRTSLDSIEERCQRHNETSLGFANETANFELKVTGNGNVHIRQPPLERTPLTPTLINNNTKKIYTLQRDEPVAIWIEDGSNVTKIELLRLYDDGGGDTSPPQQEQQFFTSEFLSTLQNVTALDVCGWQNVCNRGEKEDFSLVTTKDSASQMGSGSRPGVSIEMMIALVQAIPTLRVLQVCVHQDSPLDFIREYAAKLRSELDTVLDESREEDFEVWALVCSKPHGAPGESLYVALETFQTSFMNSTSTVESTNTSNSNNSGISLKRAIGGSNWFEGFISYTDLARVDVLEVHAAIGAPLSGGNLWGYKAPAEYDQIGNNGHWYDLGLSEEQILEHTKDFAYDTEPFFWRMHQRLKARVADAGLPPGSVKLAAFDLGPIHHTSLYRYRGWPLYAYCSEWPCMLADTLYASPDDITPEVIAQIEANRTLEQNLDDTLRRIRNHADMTSLVRRVAAQFWYTAGDDSIIFTTPTYAKPRFWDTRPWPETWSYYPTNTVHEVTGLGEIPPWWASHTPSPAWVGIRQVLDGSIPRVETVPSSDTPLYAQSCHCAPGGVCLRDGSCHCFSGRSGINCTIVSDKSLNRGRTATPLKNKCPGSTNTNAPRLGINAAGLADWTTGNPFWDMMSQGRAWIPQAYTSTLWDTGETIHLNMEGYPTHLPGDQTVGTMLNRDVYMNGRSGQYTILYDGDGILLVSLTSVKTVKRREKGRIDIMLELSTDFNNGLFVTIAKTNPTDPIRNIRVVPTEALEQYEIFPIQPHYVNLFKEFDVIRFMGWTRTNSGFGMPQYDETGNPNYLTFGNRTLMGQSRTYTDRTGVPYELCCMLANAADADMWINIPHNADDDFVLHLATLLHSHLRPELQIIIEYSNEAWGIVSDYGGLHSGGIWAASEAATLGLDSHYCYIARRTYEFRDLFIQALGEDIVIDQDRVKFLLASQAGYSAVTDYLLECDIGDGLPRASEWIDILAIAPYAGGRLKSTYGPDDETDSWIPLAIAEGVPEAINSSIDSSQSSWDRMKIFSDQRNSSSINPNRIEYWQYEGGLAFDATEDKPVNWHPLIKNSTREYYAAHGRRSSVSDGYDFQYDVLMQFGEYASGGRHIVNGRSLDPWAMVSSPFRVPDWAYMEESGEFYGNYKMEGIAAFMRARDVACASQFVSMLGADGDNATCIAGCGKHGWCADPVSWPFNGTCVCDVGADGINCENFRPIKKDLCGYHCSELSEPKLPIEYKVNGSPRSSTAWKGQCLPVESGTEVYTGADTWLASEVQEVYTCQNCLPGFEGGTCSLFECTTLDYCNFRGKCIHPGANATDTEPFLVPVPANCSCFRGFGGLDCSIDCGCIAKEDGLVHGECDSSNQCQPDSGWERRDDTLGLKWSCGNCHGECAAPSVCVSSPEDTCESFCEMGTCFLGECRCWLGYVGARCDQYVGDSSFTYGRDHPFGINIGGLRYWSTSYPLVDIGPQQMDWVSNTKRGAYADVAPWDDGRAILIEESGFPRSLQWDQVATTLVNRNTIYMSPTGTYTVVYNTDKVRLDYSMDSKLVEASYRKDLLSFDGTCAGDGASSHEEQEACSDLMGGSAYEGENGIGININSFWEDVVARASGDDIANVSLNGEDTVDYHIIMPDFADLDRWRHLPIHPLYLKYLEPFSSVLRFHGWSDQSIPNVVRVDPDAGAGSPIADGDTRKWEERIRKYQLRETHGRLHSDSGMPFEYMIDICNMIGCSPWFVVAPSVDDQYIQELRILVETTLRPDVEAFIEYVNEAWNPLFDGSHWCALQGTELNLDTEQPQNNRYRYYALRSVQVCNIWKGAAVSSRFKCILSGWAGSDSVNREILSYASSQTGASSLNETFDSFATTGYWDCGLGQDGPTNVQLSVSDMIARCRSEDQLQNFRDRMLRDQMIAGEYGMPLSTYEAGPHIVESSAIHSGRTTNGYSEKLIQVNRHPDMKEVYKMYSDIALEIGILRWVHFTDQSRPSIYGSFGLQEFTGQYHPLPPKYDAVLESIQDISDGHTSMNGCLNRYTLFGIGIGMNSFVGPPYVILRDISGQVRNHFNPGQTLLLSWKSSVLNDASNDQKHFQATSVRLVRLRESCADEIEVVQTFSAGEYVSDQTDPFLPVLGSNDNFSPIEKYYFEIIVDDSLGRYHFFSEPFWVSENEVTLTGGTAAKTVPIAPFSMVFNMPIKNTSAMEKILGDILASELDAVSVKVLLQATSRRLNSNRNLQQTTYEGEGEATFGGDDNHQNQASIASVQRNVLENTTIINEAIHLHVELNSTLAVIESVVDVPVDFHYDIIPFDGSEIVFNDASSSEEIKFYYNISNKVHSMGVFTEDCKTELSSSLLSITTSTVVGSPSIMNLNLTASIDFDATAIENDDSGIFSLSTGGLTGTLKFCMRLDLHASEGGPSVTFHETVVTVNIDMSEEFSFTGVSTNRDDAKEINKNETVRYNVFAYQCDETAMPVDIPLSQGDDVRICVETESVGVLIAYIQELSFIQDGLGGGSSNPISADTGMNGLTSITGENTQLITVRTMVTSAFFSIENSNNITVTGVAALAFGDTSRRLKDGRNSSRHLDDSGPGVSDFKAILEIVAGSSSIIEEDPRAPPKKNRSVSTTGVTLIVFTVTIVSLLGMVFWFLVQRRNRKLKQCDPSFARNNNLVCA